MGRNILLTSSAFGCCNINSLQTMEHLRGSKSEKDANFALADNECSRCKRKTKKQRNIRRCCFASILVQDSCFVLELMLLLLLLCLLLLSRSNLWRPFFTMRKKLKSGFDFVCLPLSPSKRVPTHSTTFTSTYLLIPHSCSWQRMKFRSEAEICGWRLTLQELSITGTRNVELIKKMPTD